jgi:arylsulfatase A-like enzyme
VLDDLIDFTDFYPTLAESAGVKLGEDDPIDGRSFLPQLKGQAGNPRDWVLCHYQPYWGKFPGQQFVRNQHFKLYRDGTFFNVPVDLEEAHSLALGQSEDANAARKMLNAVLEIAPPAPTKQAGKNIPERPTHPEWKNIVNPND